MQDDELVIVEFTWVQLLALTALTIKPWILTPNPPRHAEIQCNAHTHHTCTWTHTHSNKHLRWHNGPQHYVHSLHCGLSLKMAWHRIQQNGIMPILMVGMHTEHKQAPCQPSNGQQRGRDYWHYNINTSTTSRFKPSIRVEREEREREREEWVRWQDCLLPQQ